MNKSARIQQCIAKHDEYVRTLAALPDKKLIRKLETIHMQMVLAEQKKDIEALELLEIWGAQTIEARTFKAENKIPNSSSSGG